MFKIVTIEGIELGITDTVSYIKIHSNGCFIPATIDDAVGIAFHGKAYNLLGHEDIVGAETIIAVKLDGGDSIFIHQVAIEELLKTILEG